MAPYPTISRGTGVPGSTQALLRDNLPSDTVLRIEASVISISWIPFASLDGMTTIPFEFGICIYDDPPQQILHKFERNRTNARFVNELAA